jgi:hypothetical protein
VSAGGRRSAARAAFALALLLPAWSGAVGQEATHMTPPGQPPLTVLTDRNVEPVRSRFNQFVDRPRVLALLSPT